MAEAAVRTATPADMDEIARVQVVTWRAAYADLLGERALAQLDEDQVAEAWRETVQHGPATVYLATEGEWTVGFCAAGPAPAEEIADARGAAPEDAEAVGLVSTLLVEPRWGRRGHGGRLLAAAARGLRSDGARRGVCWVPEADKASIAFFERAGWLPEGTVRTLDTGGRMVREIRLTGSLDLELV